MKFFLKGKPFMLTIAVFVLLIFLHSLDLLNPIESIIFRTTAPVQKYFYNTGLKTGNFLKKLTDRTSESEVELLKAQIRSLLVQNARLKILGEENKLLKKELDFTRQHDYDFVSARVIGSDSLQNSTLLMLQLDNNTDPKEIKTNMPVVAEDGILVGKIAEIKQNQIFMLPLTASQSAIAATVLNNTYTIGVAEGDSNIAIKMGMIPQSEKLKQGELVVTSGLEAEIPKGLLLGTVSKVAHDPQNPFDIAYVTPLYDAKRLSKVLIIKGY